MCLINNWGFSWSYGHFIDGMCVVALALATITTSGATFHLFVMRLFMSGWYVVVFLGDKFFRKHVVAIRKFYEFYVI